MAVNLDQEEAPMEVETRRQIANALLVNGGVRMGSTGVLMVFYTLRRIIQE